eukprot:CAMPEP_0119321942 /NCGR_PEP_ID=MMETSP1333-20130426/56859_1 /TAXON_ID=418940 /ORGANISM="Scyphosphaera apsteinii, Strain RCC1455" /LENGTH=120 /DNA_ID=CAMNT_0007329047 /DNA_START=1201 /DNA_END=1563 /DNA_ORIENTATION=+
MGVLDRSHSSARSVLLSGKLWSYRWCSRLCSPGESVMKGSIFSCVAKVLVAHFDAPERNSRGRQCLRPPSQKSSVTFDAGTEHSIEPRPAGCGKGGGGDGDGGGGGDCKTIFLGCCSDVE